ncbi:MAG: accessory factor UbiK family protein [Arenicellales bacterium]
MLKPDNLKNSVLSLLPETLATDLKDNIDAAIQGHLSQMNLVSRKDFEIQQKVLAKTRAKLEALEKTLAELEQQHT